MKHLKRQLNTNQIYGSGLALILIMLGLNLYYKEQVFAEIALGLVILLMVWPLPFKYFGYLWFALGEGMGYVVSRIIMSVVFVFLVIPVGLIKRKHIRSSMQINAFKTGNSSLFKTRNHQYTKADFEKPF